jgi:hypothetical protein
MKENKQSTHRTLQLSDKMIEVAHGVFLLLRAAEETWAAMQQDYFTTCECTCCSIFLSCIADAAFVLCPECKTISSTENAVDTQGGVGLGLRTELAPKSRHNHASYSESNLHVTSFNTCRSNTRTDKIIDCSEHIIFTHVIFNA